MIGIGAEQKHAGLLARAAGAVQIDAGLQAQQVDQIGGVARVDVLARNDAHIGEARIDSYGDAPCRDFDRGLHRVILGMRMRRSENERDGKR